MGDVGLKVSAIAASTWQHPHVDLLVEEASLEVFIDGLVGDGGQEGHVLDTRVLLLLKALGPVCLCMSALEA